MFSPKTALIGAIAGFALSCIAGIIGSVSFGIVLLRAVLSAVFSALLVGAVHFVYVRFLADAQGDDTNFAVKATPAGSTVDITLDDAELPDTDGAPNFFVEKSDEVLSEQSSHKTNAAAHNADTLQNSSGATALNNAEAVHSGAEAEAPQNTDALQNSTGAAQNDTAASAPKTGHSLRVNSADIEGGADIEDGANIAGSAEPLVNGSERFAEGDAAQDGGQMQSFSASASGTASGAVDAQIEALPSLDGFSSEESGAPLADGQTFSAEGEIASSALGQDSIFSDPGELKKTGLSENLTDFGNTEDIAAAVRTVLKKES